MILSIGLLDEPLVDVNPENHVVNFLINRAINAVENIVLLLPLTSVNNIMETVVKWHYLVHNGAVRQTLVNQSLFAQHSATLGDIIFEQITFAVDQLCHCVQMLLDDGHVLGSVDSGIEQLGDEIDLLSCLDELLDCDARISIWLRAQQTCGLFACLFICIVYY